MYYVTEYYDLLKARFISDSFTLRYLRAIISHAASKWAGFSRFCSYMLNLWNGDLISRPNLGECSKALLVSLAQPLFFSKQFKNGHLIFESLLIPLTEDCMKKKNIITEPLKSKKPSFPSEHEQLELDISSVNGAKDFPFGFPFYSKALIKNHGIFDIKGSVLYPQGKSGYLLCHISSYKRDDSWIKFPGYVTGLLWPSTLTRDFDLHIDHPLHAPKDSMDCILPLIRDWAKSLKFQEVVTAFDVLKSSIPWPEYLNHHKSSFFIDQCFVYLKDIFTHDSPGFYVYEGFQ